MLIVVYDTLCLFQAIVHGEGWVAVATSLNMLRLFSLGGIQLNILCSPGPVISMAACKQKLCIAYSSILCEYIVYYIGTCLNNWGKSLATNLVK